MICHLHFSAAKNFQKTYLLVITTMTNLLYLKLVSFYTYIPLLDVGTSSAVNMSEDAGLSSVVDKIPDIGKDAGT